MVVEFVKMGVTIGMGPEVPVVIGMGTTGETGLEGETGETGETGMAGLLVGGETGLTGETGGGTTTAEVVCGTGAEVGGLGRLHVSGGVLLEGLYVEGKRTRRGCC